MGVIPVEGNKNILYIHSDKIVLDDMRWGLYQMGIEPDLYPKKVTMYEDMGGADIGEEKEELKGFMERKQYDVVITYDFHITVAMACQELRVKYISWIYDSPNLALYTDIAKSGYNYVFAFDKKQYERLSKEGIRHLYYLPLAANVDMTSGLIITEEDEEKYCHEISFVGSLYKENGYNEKKAVLTQESEKVIRGIIQKTALHWEKGLGCFETLDAGTVDRIYEELGAEVRGLHIDKRYMLELYLLSRKVTEIDRTGVLNALAVEHDVTLYTGTDASGLENVKIRGRADSLEEVPKIYYLSKINLNITMRSIETGIPQRVFDIMGVGGFVLSNYQEELEELFVPDREIVLFRDVPELLKKAEYYLNHEEERIRIAINGYKKVREYYNTQTALGSMLRAVFPVQDENLRNQEQGI